MVWRGVISAAWLAGARASRQSQSQATTSPGVPHYYWPDDALYAPSLEVMVVHTAHACCPDSVLRPEEASIGLNAGISSGWVGPELDAGGFRFWPH